MNDKERARKCLPGKNSRAASQAMILNLALDCLTHERTNSLAQLLMENMEEVNHVIPEARIRFQQKLFE